MNLIYVKESDYAPPESPVFDQIGKVATISWSRSNHTYMIASTSGVVSDLMKFF